MNHDFEQLNDRSFQEFCQALLLPQYPNLACLPVGMPDGGRDGLAVVQGQLGNDDGFVVFQVKFTPKGTKLEDPEAWIKDHLRQEADKVRKLVERGARRYVLVTNAMATSHLDGGSFDKVAKALDGAFEGIVAECLWRADLDRRLENRWDLKWVYPQLMTGPDLIRGLLEGRIGEDGARRTRAVKSFIADQLDRDSEVKFKQVEFEGDLLDVFVDVPAQPVDSTHGVKLAARIREIQSELGHNSVGQYPTHSAVGVLSDPLALKASPRVVVEGAPGQGKSTLVQYLCQINRLRLLERTADLPRVPRAYRIGPVRLPVRVDLRELARWLEGEDPFRRSGNAISTAPRTVEGFLATQIEASSGGATFSVDDLLAIFEASPVFLAFDGLDEVVDTTDRDALVKQIEAAVVRLEAVSMSLQIVVTSRPAAFTNAGRFSERFAYAKLTDLSRELINDYASKWGKARRLTLSEQRDIEAVLEDKLEQPHFRDLARNPMQLAILLNLVHRKGSALPDQRTALYRGYMELFLDRESDKSDAVRNHRDLVLRVHGYVAWRLHADAEADRGSGRIETEALRSMMTDFIERQGYKRDLYDDLFGRVIDRVGALFSRVQGTYEFEVQPLREYFAAIYLYETAPYSPPGDPVPGTLPERLDAMIRRPFWLNVARFYAGCYSVGEVPSLIERLEALSDDPVLRLTTLPRSVASQFIADGTFSQDRWAARRAVAVMLNGFARFHFDSAIALGLPSAERISTSVPGDGPSPSDVLLDCAARSGPAGTTPDVAGVLTHIAPESLADRWLARITDLREPDSRVNWLHFGSWLDVLSSVPRPDLLALLEGLDLSEAASALFAAELWWPAAENPALAREMFRVALEYRYTLQPPHELHVLQLASLATSVDVALRMYDYSFAAMDGPIDRQDDDAFPEAEQLVVALQTLLAASAVDLQTDPGIWREYIDTCVEVIGEHAALFQLAQAIARILPEHAVPEPRDSDSLFGSCLPILDRFLAARAHSGDATWWRQQLVAATTSEQRITTLSAILAIPDGATFADLWSDFQLAVEALSETDVWALKAQVGGLRGAAYVGRSDRVEVPTSDAFPRALVVAQFRLQEEALAAGFVHAFDTASAEDQRLAKPELLREAIRRLKAGESTWPRILELARNSMGWELGRQRAFEDLEMPDWVVDEISVEPVAFPEWLAAAADRNLIHERGGAAEPLRDVAVAEKWFPEK